MAHRANHSTRRARRAAAFVTFVSALAACAVWGIPSARGADADIVEDVVYGHKLGLAMTFDVYRPKAGANGAGVLFMVSGGWYSTWAPPASAMPLFAPLLDKGFTVFAVRHGSSPKFSIPEAVSDVRRAVRFIRSNAARWDVDPNRLGVFGMSAGGHLSLMLATASDEGDSANADPIERASDRVAAVVAIVAPTDLRIMVWEAPEKLPAYKQFPALDLDLESAQEMSPLVHVSQDDSPTLLIAGDKDDLVPIAHSERIHAAFGENKVVSEFLVLKGAGHGFRGDDQRRAFEALVGWFEKHLAKPQ
ncbi:MAG: alpha/beta hydrolase [Planctomycetes bacterium]|nr:alpha/beta hydrolase [Planctomycetota bacterium]